MSLYSRLACLLHFLRSAMGFAILLFVSLSWLSSCVDVVLSTAVNPGTIESLGVVLCVNVQLKLGLVDILLSGPGLF